MATRRAAAVYDTFFRLVLQRSMGSMDAKLQALGAGNFQGYTLKICQNLVEKESRRQKEEEGASKDRVEYFTKMMEANKKRAEQMESGNAEIGITNTRRRRPHSAGNLGASHHLLQRVRLRELTPSLRFLKRRRHSNCAFKWLQ
jgi:hypothetical protein